MPPSTVLMGKCRARRLGAHRGLPAQENEACEAVGTRERGESATDGERVALTAFLSYAVLAGGNAVCIRFSNRELALSSAELQRGLRRTELVGGVSVQRSPLNHVEVRGPVYP